MARTREFDPEKALQVAVDVFWEKGYFDASVDEVVRRSGVAKYGIYGTFGTKDELFKKALLRYAEDRRAGMQSYLRSDDAALPELRKFYREAARMMTSDDHRYGCLLCNAGTEIGNSDPEVFKIVQDFFAEMTLSIKECLARAVEKKQLSAEKNSMQVARFLATEFRTMLMLSRCGESRRSINSHVKVALSILD